MPKLITIKECPEAESLAQPLIRDHHTHLTKARILYLLTTQTRRNKDRVVLGTAGKNTPLMRYLSSYVNSEQAGVEDGADFVILFSAGDFNLLTTEQKAAAVDHELSHCQETVKYSKKTMTETRSWTLVAHEIEEFTAVIARHGLWRYDLHRMAVISAIQLGLPEGAVETAIKTATGTKAAQNG